PSSREESHDHAMTAPPPSPPPLPSGPREKTALAASEPVVARRGCPWVTAAETEEEDDDGVFLMPLLGTEEPFSRLVEDGRLPPLRLRPPRPPLPPPVLSWGNGIVIVEAN
ncbi:unnamed protein product, partial [Ectocarpus sp. 8 AP-2014]